MSGATKNWKINRICSDPHFLKDGIGPAWPQTLFLLASPSFPLARPCTSICQPLPTSPLENLLFLLARSSALARQSFRWPNPNVYEPDPHSYRPGPPQIYEPGPCAGLLQRCRPWCGAVCMNSLSASQIIPHGFAHASCLDMLRLWKT